MNHSIRAGIAALVAATAQTVPCWADPAEAPLDVDPPLLGSDPLAPGRFVQLPDREPPEDPLEFETTLHAYATTPVYVGIREREAPHPDESSLDIQVPANVPWIDSNDWRAVEAFNDEGALVSLSLSHGNEWVHGGVVFSARKFNEGFFEKNEPVQLQSGALTFYFDDVLLDGLNVDTTLGAPTQGYGIAGLRTTGLYQTFLHGVVSGVGGTIGAEKDLGGLKLRTEHGLSVLEKGRFADPIFGPDVDIDYGTTFSLHSHLAARVEGIATLRAHAIYSFVRDSLNLTGEEEIPKGEVMITGIDGHVSGGVFGNLFVGLSQLQAVRSASLGPGLYVLNSPGGEGLMRNFLGPDSNGTGIVNTFMGQYQFSLARLLWHPLPYQGEGPDLVFTLAGMYHMVTSKDSDYNGSSKLKAGADLEYRMLDWLAAGLRYDEVHPMVDDDAQSFKIIAPRLTLRTSFLEAPVEVTLRYQRALYGNDVSAPFGEKPDNNTVLLRATAAW